MQDVQKNIMDAKTDFDNFIRKHYDTSLDTKSHEAYIGQWIKYKNDVIEPPSRYLGAQLKEKKLPNGEKCWGLSSDKYVNAAISNVENSVKKKGRKVPNKLKHPMTSDFVPELDISLELGFITEKNYKEISSRNEVIQKQLNAFISKLKKY